MGRRRVTGGAVRETECDRRDGRREIVTGGGTI